MDRVARLPARDRRDLFSGAASQLGIRPTIIEKDFWVCFVLKRLFSDSAFKDHLVFKGGTSLSKVYRLIERFSEDVDLVLDWKLLDPDITHPSDTIPTSKSKQDQFNKKANQLAGQFIDTKLRPHLHELLQQTGAGLTATTDPNDAQIINIAYPAAFAETYIRPEVRLEIGPLASWVPSARHRVAPYASEAFPAVFEDPSFPVLTIAAERTFWEKATILHQEAHRQGLPPTRYSRHYYDLFKMGQSIVRDEALRQLNLLRDVVQFKEQFYPSKWARYDLAKPGSFKLLPTREIHLEALRRDYQDMQLMLFGDPPNFAQILQALKELEEQINALSSATSQAPPEAENA